MIQKETQILSAYIDGTLPAEKKEEFEKILKLRKDLQDELLLKRTQISKISAFIPKTKLSQESREVIQNEIKSSLNQFIQETPESYWTKFKNLIFNR